MLCVLSVCLPVYLCTTYMQTLWKPEEGVGSTEFELEMIVINYHVGAELKSGSLIKG